MEHTRSHAPRKVSRPAARKTRGKTHHSSIALTSQPTGRNAMMETRRWLLERHGPVCAYCGSKFSARVMTLDHVAPRRGQKAYDRRDNLVLACPGCNIAKRDQAPLAFLLASRVRAENLVKYGDHLSDMLFNLARSLVPPERLAQLRSDRKNGKHREHSRDNESPYAD